VLFWPTCMGLFIVMGLGPTIRGWQSIRWAGGMLIFFCTAGWASPWNNTHLSWFLYLSHPYSILLFVDVTTQAACDNMIRTKLPTSVTLFCLFVSQVLSFGLSRFTSLSLHFLFVFIYLFIFICSLHCCPIFPGADFLNCGIFSGSKLIWQTPTSS